MMRTQIIHAPVTPETYKDVISVLPECAVVNANDDETVAVNNNRVFFMGDGEPLFEL